MVDGSITSLGCSDKGITSERWRNTYGWEMAGLVVLIHGFIKKYKVIVFVNTIKIIVMVQDMEYIYVNMH